MIRRIVVLLTGTASDQPAATVATAIAKRVGAGVEGLSIKTDPSDLMFRLGEGVAATAIDDLIKAAERTSDEAAARGRATLEAAAKSAGLEVLDAPGERPGSGVYSHSVQGPALDVLTMQAGLADLVVFGEPGEKAPVDLSVKIEHALMVLRRPILVACGQVSPTLGDKILVPFNGTVEACAALTSAASIIGTAKSSEILHLREREKDTGIAMNALRYIRQHGGNATIQEQSPSGRGIGEDISTRATVIGADLVVMGGYGRSRLRELVLGGATRHMIYHAPVPVLLAH